jgi:hypothetical protein
VRLLRVGVFVCGVRIGDETGGDDDDSDGRDSDAVDIYKIYDDCIP